MHVATMIDSANRADFFSDLRNLYRGSAASPLTSILSMSGKVTLNLRSQNSVISVAHTHTHTHTRTRIHVRETMQPVVKLLLPPPLPGS